MSTTPFIFIFAYHFTILMRSSHLKMKITRNIVHLLILTHFRNPSRRLIQTASVVSSPRHTIIYTLVLHSPHFACLINLNFLLAAELPGYGVRIPYNKLHIVVKFNKVPVNRALQTLDFTPHPRYIFASCAVYHHTPDIRSYVIIYVLRHLLRRQRQSV